MDRPVYFRFVSNASPFLRSRIIESLATVWIKKEAGRPILVNADSGVSLPLNNKRSVNDDPVARYGSTTCVDCIPLLSLEQAVDFLEDAIKTKNLALAKDRSILVLTNEPPSVEAIKLYDALCFAVTNDSASNAFVYKALRSMMDAHKRIPVRILVVGETDIEKAALFFVSLSKELKEIGDGFVELSFSGFLSLNQEELELSSAYGLPLIEAFPKGVHHGEAKYAVKSFFLRDFSELDDDWPEREKLLIKMIRSGIY